MTEATPTLPALEPCTDLVEMREWAEGRAKRCSENPAWNISVDRYTGLVALLDELQQRRAPSPAALGEGEKELLENVADAIDEARYASPRHRRERPRPFSKADASDREYAMRLARAAISATALTDMRGERERLREACRVALLHAPSIKLAPERRHTIAVLEAALNHRAGKEKADG